MSQETQSPARDAAARDARSRRSFLAGATSVASLPAAFLALGGTTFAKKQPQPRFKHLPELFSGENLRIFDEILQDEEDHIVQLTKLADDPRPMPTFRNLVADSPVDFVMMAAMIENGGVGSYIQGLNAISQGGHHDYFLTAAGITAVEAQHTGFLNALLNEPIAPSAAGNHKQPGIAPPIPPSVIRAAVGPFILSLSGGPPLDYNINQVDDDNDQAIINFVLALEFLEVEFYRMNIERYFRFI
jgi:hypothetical protein